MANSRSWPKPRSFAAALIAAAVASILGLSSLELFGPYVDGATEPYHRSLNLSKQNFLFWHIPKSGGTTAKELYKCAGKIIDIQSQPPDILRAKESGLVQSGIVDIIFSSRPDFALNNLYDQEYPATVLAMFRHPVERLVSKFYYLQIADWEKTYKPAWKNMDILQWARSGNTDNEHMVKKLAGKGQRAKVTETDLLNAKDMIRQKFTVGLMDHMEESMHRFNKVMGMSEDSRTRGCMAVFFGKHATKKNSNTHPKVEEGSDAWKLLAEKNKLDIQLYEYVIELFDDQREIIESHARSANEAEA